MIAEDILLRQPWQYGRSLGQVIYPKLEFMPDGLLQPWSASEARWRLTDNVLELCDQNGAPTTRFHRHQRLSGGGIRLTGRFLLQPDMFLYHFLDTVGSDAPLKESRLNVFMSLSGESDALLVIFNSAGGPSEGWDSRWEFFRLPDELGLDHIRFAEMRAPTVFYLDKTKQICRILGVALEQGYRRVLMAGMSSGAYVGMLVGEMLCGTFPEVEFLTFGINPQTTQVPQQARAFYLSAPAGMAPMLLSDYAYSLRDCDEMSVAELARRNRPRRPNIHHDIFFDSLNPVEAAYADLVADIPGFRLHPQALGLSHMASCIALFESRVAHTAMAAALSASRAW